MWSLVNLKDAVQISTFTYRVTSPCHCTKLDSFWGFCPWHMVKSCAGKVVPKDENVRMYRISVAPHPISEDRCSQKSLNAGQTHSWYFPASFSSLQQFTADPGVTAFYRHVKRDSIYPQETKWKNNHRSIDIVPSMNTRTQAQDGSVICSRTH